MKGMATNRDVRDNEAETVGGDGEEESEKETARSGRVERSTRTMSVGPQITVLVGQSAVWITHFYTANVCK